MFKFFETLVDPYPQREPETPPRQLLAFLFHYSRPLLPLLLVMSVVTALVSIVEVTFFAYIGELVDWLSAAERETFLADYGWQLAGMALLALVVFPLLVLTQSLIEHQGIFGNYPMIVRWLAHRYILDQSLSFFRTSLPAASHRKSCRRRWLFARQS